MDLFEDPAPAKEIDFQDKIVSVMPVRPLDKAYSYGVPSHMTIREGDYVLVPFGKSTMVGVVWDNPPDQVPVSKLKQILDVYDISPMPEKQRRFLEWMAEYTLTPLGQVLKMAVPNTHVVEGPAPVTAYRIKEGFISENAKLTPQRRKVLELLDQVGGGTASQLAEVAGVSDGVVRGMEKAGILETYSYIPDDGGVLPIEKIPAPATLSPIQQKAADSLTADVKTGSFEVTLLDGVTGSGKTEVYFAPVRRAITDGKQVLVLVPEIALTQQFLGRFKKRFGVEPAQWHSNMTSAQRRKVWRGVAKGQVQVVVGARSALFLPFQRLGLIIVDEEHDSSYKQEEGGGIYHARDMAVVRGQHESAPVVLVSATPSLETIHNVEAGKYKRLHLPERHGKADLPDVHVVDMRAQGVNRQTWLSPVLLEEMKRTLGENEQVLLFLNRRGYAPLTLCRTCGHRMECPRCSAWLVQHKSSRKLLCHHCGYTDWPPDKCPNCEDVESLVACGPGVERIYEETLKHFGSQEICILSSDLQKDPKELSAVLKDIAEKRYDIVIGTQIIAKGHHFPYLTLVGVLDADLGLSGGDLRASEKTFQLLHQVAGRAGREEHKGKVLLQTYMPEHPVMQALSSDNRDDFYAIESQQREQAGMPPVTRLVSLILSGEKDNTVIDYGRRLVGHAPPSDKVDIWGPAPAVMHRLRDKFRHRILLRAPKNIKIQNYISQWLASYPAPSNIRVQVDIDPYSFY